jgi:hypothetical protein
VTPEDRRLISLAAVFLPDRTGPLFARVAPADAASLGEAASRAASAPRRDRLRALAAQLDTNALAPLNAELARALLGAERGRTTAAFLTLTSPDLSVEPPDGPRPALRRLLHEFLGGRPAEARSCVRGPNASMAERAGGPVLGARHDP